MERDANRWSNLTSMAHQPSFTARRYEMVRSNLSRIIAVSIVGFVLVFSQLACGSDGNGNGEPTPTPTPEIVDTPSEDDYLKWAPAVAYVAIVNSICETLLASQANLASGEITGVEAYGQVFLAAGMLGSFQEDLPGWEPASGQGEIKRRLLEHVDVMKPILDSWLAQQLSTEDTLAQLADICPDVEATYDLLLVEAAKDGFTPFDIEAMLAEMSAGGDEQPFGD
jgi:hypothetical protein